MAVPKMTDFLAMSDPDLLAYCGADASKWAEAFCRIKEARGWSAADINEGLMIGWFANVIEHSQQVRGAAQAPLRQPTEDMLNAARDWSIAKYGRGIGNDAAIGVWQAMLAACGGAAQEATVEALRLEFDFRANTSPDDR